MHPENSFITLTYDDQHLKSDKLIYRDFQLFMKKLRKTQNEPIGVFVTGEYGDKNKRPHWHAIIFNWRPKDATRTGTTDRGDEIYTSGTLEKLWPQGRAELGSVTFQSAGYVARYAAKKLGNGLNPEEFKPISKKSSKHAIGKKWLEKFWPDIFNYGTLVIDGKPVGSIPRYYEKWLQKHQPQAWFDYVTQIKVAKQLAATKQAAIDQSYRPYSNSKLEARRKITNSKFQKLLQNFLKL